MASVTDGVISLAEQVMRDNLLSEPGVLARRIAEALRWDEGPAAVQRVDVGGQLGQVSKALYAGQPAVVFASNGATTSDFISEAALYAYHASVEWGAVADNKGVIIFNSHRIRRNAWYTLPPYKWTDAHKQQAVWEGMTPTGLLEGAIERVADRSYPADHLLLPVDDALVERLDEWRAEAMRYAEDTDDLDERLQILFAQLFVLRAVEDRGIPNRIGRLEDVIEAGNWADEAALRRLFRRAKTHIKSELFDSYVCKGLPPEVLGQMIVDLYQPRHIPASAARYNFAWVDADVLGNAYQKYLETLLVPVPPSPQLSLWLSPLRDVERVPARKKSGAYYTPSFLVRYLAERCVSGFFETSDADKVVLPTIVDCACGSGSFLVAAADAVIRKLRAREPNCNWGRSLIEQKRIIGMDIDNRAVTLAKLALWLRLAEEPDALPLPRLSDIIVQGDALKEESWRNLPRAYDVFIGNPPFMALQNVQSPQELGSRFESAQGRFDYSSLFLETALKKLAENGMLGLVVPNRLFRNRDATPVRALTNRLSTLLTIIDFRSSEVFPGISAYIGTLLARKGQPDNRLPVRFVQVSEWPCRFAGAVLAQAEQATGPYKLHRVVAFDASRPRDGEPWAFLSSVAQAARIRLENISESLGDIAGVFQGIKTGANDIFIVTLQQQVGNLADTTNGFGERTLLEADILRPLAFGSEIQRYDQVSTQRYLIYPYQERAAVPETELREKYPQAYAYLSRYRSLLSMRAGIAQSRLRWYELIRRRDENWLLSPKLLTRDLAVETSFAVDADGSALLVGGVAVVPSEPALLLPLLAFLNSSVANWYASLMTTGFRAGFQKFEPQHLNAMQIPISVRRDDKVRETLAHLAAQVLDARSSNDSLLQSRYEADIDALIADLTGIHLEEVS